MGDLIVTQDIAPSREIARLTPSPGEPTDQPGRGSFVGAGPGDADLITLRGWQRLQQADVILYDSLVDHSLLNDVNGDLVYVGKRCGNHSQPQRGG